MFENLFKTEVIVHFILRKIVLNGKKGQAEVFSYSIYFFLTQV